MFFADPARSFANLRKGLRPGGRLAFACWREAKQNPWLIVPLREAAKYVPPLPETGPEDPGPFAFASEERVRRILSDAGFADIMLSPQDLELDIAAGRGLDTAVKAAMTIGPTSRALDGQSEGVRAAAAGDIRKQGSGGAWARRQRATRRRHLDGHGDQPVHAGQACNLARREIEANKSKDMKHDPRHIESAETEAALHKQT
jgi:hypothetical protein